MESSFFAAPFTSAPPRVIETERLILRAITAGDGQLLFDLYAHDREVSKYMSFKVTGRVEDSEFFAQSVGDFFNGKADAPVRTFGWVIQEKASGQSIGSASLNPMNETTVNGGYILNRSFWGNRYAPEVWTKLVRIAQADPGVQRIEACHHPDNPASGKVLLSAGMACEGIRSPGGSYPNISDQKIDDIRYAWNRK